MRIRKFAAKRLSLTLSLSRLPLIQYLTFRFLLLRDLRAHSLGFGFEHLDPFVLVRWESERKKFPSRHDLLARSEVLLDGVEALSARISRAAAAVPTESK